MNSVQLASESRAAMGSNHRLETDEIKHLDLVQAVISRMAQHSFQLKGWSVTVATAVIALAAKESSPGLAALALFPAIAFWCLDAYYLRQERLYRKLYEAIVDPLKIVQAFAMTTEEYTDEVGPWGRTLFAKALMPLHGAIVVVILIEMMAFLISVWIVNFKG